MQATTKRKHHPVMGLDRLSSYGYNVVRMPNVQAGLSNHSLFKVFVAITMCQTGVCSNFRSPVYPISRKPRIQFKELI